MQKLQESESETEVNNAHKLSSIPNGWEYENFDRLVFFQEGPGLRNWQFKTQGMKVINVTNIVNGKLDLSLTSRHIDIDEFKQKYKHFAIDANDIVVASSGNSYCKVGVVEKKDLPLMMNTSVIRMKSISEKLLNRKYLEYFLHSQLFRKQIDLLITGAAQPNFGPFHLKRIRILRPSSIIEQQKIASVLSNVDELIQKTDQIIEQTQRLKKGLMQRLLTKGIGHTNFKKTVLGKIPQEWKVMKLTDLCDVITDGVHFTPKYQVSGVPFVSVNNMSTGKLDFSNCKFISREDHNDLVKRCAPKKGDLLLSKVGTLGIADVIEVEFEFSIFVQLALIKPTKTKLDPIYLKNILNSPPLQKQINSFASGSTLRYIGINKISNLTIPCPDIKEQQKIASILSSLDLHIQKQYEKKSEIKNLKKGLMQKLLTGKIRVKV
jgi:type I restriction enzyme S subunit